MTKNTIILLILTLFSFPTFGQTKTDVKKDKLFGKVKYTYSYKVNYENIKDTVFFSKNFYNENGMKLKYFGLPKRIGTDSIINTYDKHNRIISKIVYESSINYSSDQTEKSIDTTYYEYNNKCEDYTVLKNPKGTYQINYVFDENCRMISETEIGRGSTNTTSVEFDKKGRLIKQTFTYLGGKPNKLETYKYDDENNTLTYVEYSPRYDVYREKTITQFNQNNKIVQKTFLYEPTAGGEIIFKDGSKKEPDQIKLIRKYQYDSENKLIGEIHLDGNNNEIIKVEIFYDEKGELKEQKFYKMGKLEYREEYKYENGKRVEEKQFLPNKKTPEYIKTEKYNDNGQIIELIQLVEGDNYSNQYLYDSFNNEIEKNELKNGKLLKTEFTKIEYYQ